MKKREIQIVTIGCSAFCCVFLQVRTCQQCQRRKPSFRSAEAELHPIPVAPVVFRQWGVDLVGPLPVTTRGNRYIIAATDYFTKWPEAAAIVDKSAVSVAPFLYSLYCRYGSCTIITDLGTEFNNQVGIFWVCRMCVLQP